MKRLLLVSSLAAAATFSASAQTNTYPFPSSGNVGIGTTTPDAPLSVNGRIRSTAWHPYGSESNDFYVDVTPNTRILRTRNWNESAPNIGATGIHTGTGWFEGNVGIGTISPQSNLHLYKQNTASRTSVQDLIYLSSTHADVGYDGFGTGIVDFRRTYRNGTPHAINRISMIERGHSQNDFGGAITFETKALNSGSAAPVERMRIDYNGNVGIGTTNPTHKLAVNGTIKAKEVIVETTGWSDYVFADDYVLQPLAEVEAHIKTNKHLPGIPSAAQVASEGVSVGELQARLLAKIEELTLHQIAQEKELKRLRCEVDALRKVSAQ